MKKLGIMLSFCWLIIALWMINDAKPAELDNSKVEQNATGVIFKDDADANITLPIGKFKLIVYDPLVQENDDQKDTSFCFEANPAARPEINPSCPQNYCEIKINYGIIMDDASSMIHLGTKNVAWGSQLVEVEVYHNQMYVIGRESKAVDVCHFDLDQPFLSVKLINKGDRSVFIENGELALKDNTVNDFRLQDEMVPLIVIGILTSFAIVT
uniref:FHA domain-containing protein n=1 Tax=Panagrolaimus sp. JU765 TaxID=591449 RepID=A0AC34QJE0_9BILA